MIGGIEAPTEGMVRPNGKDVPDLPAYKRNVNTVFQSYGLFPHLNVYDNVAFGLRRHHVPAQEVQRRGTEALALLSRAGYGEQRGAQRSRGPQPRVGLARALGYPPPGPLLREPLRAPL